MQTEKITIEKDKIPSFDVEKYVEDLLNGGKTPKKEPKNSTNPLPVKKKTYKTRKTRASSLKWHKQTRAQEDLLFMMQEVLGYKYNKKKRKGIKGDDPVHEALYETLNDDARFKLIMMFRGSYKTTHMVGLTIQELARDFNRTILIGGDAWKHARKVLKEVKFHLEHNKKLTDLYGDFKPKRNDTLKQWNKDNIDIEQRNPELMFREGIREPSIGTCGTDAEVTGSHPDLFILDDCVGAKNITTFEQKNKVIDYINESIPLLGTDGRLIMVGTPWAYDDAYNYVQENWLGKIDKNGLPLFDYLKMGILNDEDEPTMPNVYGRPEIDAMRQIIPTFEWACQYMCDPIAEGNTLLSLSDVLEFEHLPPGLPDDYEVYITVDPAISLNPRKCWTGIVAGIPHKQNLYVDLAERYKVLPQALIEELLNIVDRYRGEDGRTRVRRIGIEEQSFQKIYAGSLMNELRAKMQADPRLNRVSVVPLQPNDNKHRRIFALEPFFKHHQIYIRKGSQNALYQLHHYPHLSDTNLDILDALAYQLQLVPSTYIRNPYGIIKARESSLRDYRDGFYYDSDLLRDENYDRYSAW